MDAVRIETAKRAAVIRLGGVVSMHLDDDEQIVLCCRDIELIVNDLAEELVRQCAAGVGGRTAEGGVP